MKGESSIVLIGYRGSGKSTIGRLLAGQLGRRFFDTDEMIVQTAGQSIREIFEHSGEEKFRQLEIAAVSLAAIIPSAVIALGGGAPTRKQNRDAIRLAGGTVVYLACTAEKLYERILADTATRESRPSLTSRGGGLDEVRELLAQREPLYRGMAAHVVDVTISTPAAAAAAVIAALGQSLGKKE